MVKNIIYYVYNIICHNRIFLEFDDGSE